MKPSSNFSDIFTSPFTGQVPLPQGDILVGGSDNLATPSETISVDNLPNLTEGYVWAGDSSNRPHEVVMPGGGGGIPGGGMANQILQTDGTNPVWGSYITSDETYYNLSISPEQRDALQGQQNIVIGQASLPSASTGYNNLAIGPRILGNLTTGTYNFGIGPVALSQVTTSGNNIAIGVGSLSCCQSSGNTALGHLALYLSDQFATATEQATNNTAVGYEALFFNRSGNNNTAVGMKAMYNNINGGSNNTAIGYNSGPSTGLTTPSNTTAIGANASVTANNSIVLGSGTCNVGIGVTGPSYGIHLGATNSPFTPQIYLTSSTAPTGSISSNDAVLYVNSGSLYYRSGTTNNQIPTKNYVDTQTISPSRLTGYPSDGTKFLKGDGTWASISNSIVLTYTSSTSFTVPSGVTAITVTCVGAGGGGANATQAGASAGGGGGATAISLLSVTPGSTLTLTIGAGGTGGVGNVTTQNTGTNGGNTTVLLGSTTLVNAIGGKAPTSAAVGAAGGVGGTTSGCVGTILYAGGAGGSSSGTASANTAGAGGSTYMTNNIPTPGPVTNSTTPQLTGVTGVNGGGGTSGSSYGTGKFASGGNGSNGVVTIAWSA